MSFQDKVNGLVFKLFQTVEDEMKTGTIPAELIAAQLLTLKTTLEHLTYEDSDPLPLEIQLLSVTCDVILKSIARAMDCDFELRKFSESKHSH